MRMPYVDYLCSHQKFGLRKKVKVLGIRGLLSPSNWNAFWKTPRPRWRRFPSQPRVIVEKRPHLGRSVATVTRLLKYPYVGVSVKWPSVWPRFGPSPIAVWDVTVGCHQRSGWDYIPSLCGPYRLVPTPEGGGLPLIGRAEGGGDSSAT